MHPKAKGRWVHATKGKNVKNTIGKKCVHLGQLILRKISKIGGAYSAPPDRLTVFKGPTSKGREGKGGRGREGERERGGRRGWKEERGGKGKEGKGGKKGGMGACTHWDFRKSAPMTYCNNTAQCT